MDFERQKISSPKGVGLDVMGCTRCRNTSEVIRVSGRSGRDNWLSSTLVKLRYDQ
jgi:hypothetical protein